MRTPDWQSDDGAIQLHCCDCMQLLPTIPDGTVDAVVTDPPYGLGDRWTGGTWGADPMYEDARQWDRPISQEVIDSIVSSGDKAIVWGGNYYIMPASRCWLSWRKSSRMTTMADFELAWTNLDRPAKEITEDRNPDGKRKHPTQKPISVMLWTLDFVPHACTILDPFLGSGTTAIACIRTGRRFIGCEIEPRYFDIAVRRIKAELAQPRLFKPEPVKVEQAVMFGEPP